MASHSIPEEHFSPAKLRSTKKTFCFPRDCLYCARPKKAKMQKNAQIKTLTYLSRLKRQIFQRDDEWAYSVYGRNNICVDLVATESKYHCSCMQVFYTGRANPVIPIESTTKIGRKHCIFRWVSLDDVSLGFHRLRYGWKWFGRDV